MKCVMCRQEDAVYEARHSEGQELELMCAVCLMERAFYLSNVWREIGAFAWTPILGCNNRAGHEHRPAHFEVCINGTDLVSRLCMECMREFRTCDRENWSWRICGSGWYKPMTLLDGDLKEVPPSPKTCRTCPQSASVRGFCHICRSKHYELEHLRMEGISQRSDVKDLSPHLHSVVLRPPLPPQPCDNDEDFNE